MAKSKFSIKLSKEEGRKGIWRFWAYLTPLQEQFSLSLGEGNTPEVIFEDKLILKREDKNPTGSLKDRGMAYLISWACQNGFKNLVLSSSGNAAISAAAFCDLAKLNLFVFVSPSIEKKKMEKIAGNRVKIFKSSRPVSDATKFAQENKYFNLRPSINKFGSEGYQTIAFEIAESQGFIEDLFLPVSSGVALKGIAEGFKKLGFLPRFHLCQPAAVCPLASIFDHNFVPEKKNLAKSLVARYTPLRQEIINLIKESSGSGWVINNQAILEAEKILAKNLVTTSYEGALALAAVFKAREQGLKLGKTVCLLTGTRY